MVIIPFGQNFIPMNNTHYLHANPADIYIFVKVSRVTKPKKKQNIN